MSSEEAEGLGSDEESEDESTMSRQDQRSSGRAGSAGNGHAEARSSGARDDNTSVRDTNIIPDNNMGITETPASMDPNLIEQIVVCLPQDFTDAEKKYTNNDLATLRRKEARELCKKCKYKSVNNRGAWQEKTVTISNTLDVVVGRLLAYYQVYRLQQALGGSPVRDNK